MRVNERDRPTQAAISSGRDRVLDEIHEIGNRAAICGKQLSQRYGIPCRAVEHIAHVEKALLAQRTRCKLIARHLIESCFEMRLSRLHTITGACCDRLDVTFENRGQRLGVRCS